jgi:hypothetical protein
MIKHITLKTNTIKKMLDKYWWTSEEMGLSPAEKADKIEELWVKENTSVRSCPDCSVKSNTVHMIGCDVARCMCCGGQALSCDCKDTEKKWSGKWSGLWPGIKECYEQKLIIWSDPNRIGGTGWAFDLNELAAQRSNGKIKT